MSDLEAALLFQHHCTHGLDFSLILHQRAVERHSPERFAALIPVSVAQLHRHPRLEGVGDEGLHVARELSSFARREGDGAKVDAARKSHRDST